MQKSSIAKKILIFLLFALLICLLANINQFIGMLIDDPGRPMRHHMRPPRDFDMMRIRLTLEICISFIGSFLLIVFNSGMLRKSQHHKDANQRGIIAISILAGLLLFFLLTLLFIPNRHFASRFIYIIMSKTFFVMVSSIAIGQLYRLIWQKQKVELENEMLKTDNLQSRYMVLMDQVNPHFLFNSLNSLSYLIRENNNEKALTFIDELSSIYRYVLQKRYEELVTLEEEMLFTQAYRYLLDIRFEHKLFIDIQIGEEEKRQKLPFLSLQPLIENAVKHNVISSKQPLTISIFTREGCLVVSNPIIQKITPEKSTGIGLANLSKRYKLLTGSSISVENDGSTFVVTIPLI